MKTDTQENNFLKTYPDFEECKLDKLEDLVHEFPLNDEFIGKFDLLLDLIKNEVLDQKQKFTF